MRSIAVRYFLLWSPIAIGMLAGSEHAIYAQNRADTAASSFVVQQRSFTGYVFTGSKFEIGVEVICGDSCRMWIPSAEQIILLEKRFSKYFRKKIVHEDDFDVRLKKYYRQYLGYINEKGEHVILINLFYNPDDMKKDIWRQTMCKVFGGGSHYFNIKYNLDKNTFFDLYINGMG